MTFEPANGIQPTGIIHTGPSGGFDVIEILPPRARDRLRQLRQRSRDQHRVMPEFADVHDLATQKMQAEARLRQLITPRADGGFGLREKDDARVIEQKKSVDRLTDELQRLKALDAVRSEAWRGISQLTAAVESWSRDGKPPGTVLQNYDGGEPPKLLKGESITDAIERLRRRVRELRADIHRIKSAPFPSSYAKERMRAEIEAWATIGAPSVSDLLEHDRRVTFPSQRVQSSIVGIETAALAFAELDAAIPFTIWLHKDAIIKRLDAEIDAEADDAAALSHDARQQQEAVVLGDLLAVERDESALVWRAMHERLPVDHRSDCAPQAILQCMVVTAPRVEMNGYVERVHAIDVIHHGGQRG